MTAPEPTPLRVVQFNAENFKRLKVVQITPTGDVVEVTGRNGQGKTSVLDALWSAIAGAGTLQSEPIRKGTTRAVIRLDLGDIVVTRTIKRKTGDDGADDGFTTEVKVEAADGSSFKRPQEVLNAIMGDLTFDPLAFTRMAPKDQFDALKVFVPGVDFDEIARLNDSDFARRTDVNRDAKAARTRADGIVAPDTRPEPVEVRALLDEIEAADAANLETQRRGDQRKAAVAHLADLDTQIEKLTRERDELKAKIEGAEALPDLIDVAPLRERLAGAEGINAQVARFDEKKKAVEEATRLEAESAALTAAMAARKADVEKAVASAKMPVPGLTFGEGAVLLNDVPFNQASDAEQLEAAVAVAAAMNPRLRIIRIRDGSLLDDDAMKRLYAIAARTGFQVWIERVDSTGEVGFVLEDGMVKSQPTAPAEEHEPVE